MPNDELVEIGYKCKFRYTRYTETWGTCFPLYLNEDGYPNVKGWKTYGVYPPKPYEMNVFVRHSGTGNWYHWLVFGIFKMPAPVPQDGLYRADAANGPPYTLLEFPFPQHAAYPCSPFVAEPVPPFEEVDPDYEPAYRYIRVRAIVGAPDDNVSFTFAYPGWLAINHAGCCEYGQEAPTIKIVDYELIGQPSMLLIGAVITDGTNFDIGNLPPEYDGKRHPGVRWYIYVLKEGMENAFSRNRNNPTIFTIDFTMIID